MEDEDRGGLGKSVHFPPTFSYTCRQYTHTHLRKVHDLFGEPLKKSEYSVKKYFFCQRR